MIHVLNEALGFPVNFSEESHFIGAIGAALFALDHVLGSRLPAATREVEA
jgi:activator of 2-hydroxyglutaryl-CoA dehydratase